MEVWKDIPEYEGLYQVSNHGQVKSLNYNKTGKEKILVDKAKGVRYPAVILCKNGIHKRESVHRLVWEAFNGPIPEGYEINHNDENPFNNHLTNLSLVTRKENMNYGTRTERAREKREIPVIQYDLNGNFVRRWKSGKEVQDETGWSKGNISSCCYGKRKTTHGYIWRFE